MATTPSVIQAWANNEGAALTSIATALSAISAGITALDTMITNFQNSPGTLSPSDQAALDAIQTQSAALVAQSQAVSTTPPGTPVPAVPALKTS